MTSRFGVFLVALVGAVVLLALPAKTFAAANPVISEYGGCRMSATSGLSGCGAGSSSGNDEFVELYNPTASPVDISGWLIQRRTASGTTSCWAALPAGQLIAPLGFYLVGGPGYDAVHYTGAPGADYVSSTGTSITGVSESLVLISFGVCTASTGVEVVDSVSFGSITDVFSGLRLPPISGASLSNGTSAERKACSDSTASANSDGMLPGGGHANKGNGRSSGSSSADWIVRPSPNPQSSTSGTEIPCALAVPSLSAWERWALGLLLLGSALLVRPRRYA